MCSSRAMDRLMVIHTCSHRLAKPHMDSKHMDNSQPMASKRMASNSKLISLMVLYVLKHMVLHMCSLRLLLSMAASMLSHNPSTRHTLRHTLLWQDSHTAAETLLILENLHIAAKSISTIGNTAETVTRETHVETQETHVENQETHEENQETHEDLATTVICENHVKRHGENRETRATQELSGIGTHDVTAALAERRTMREHHTEREVELKSIHVEIVIVIVIMTADVRTMIVVTHVGAVRTVLAPARGHVTTTADAAVNPDMMQETETEIEEGVTTTDAIEKRHQDQIEIDNQTDEDDEMRIYPFFCERLLLSLYINTISYA